MISRFTRGRGLAVTFWILACCTVVILALLPSFGGTWDFRVYMNAVHSLRAGHDPYTDCIAVQRTFHEHLASHPDATPPYCYVYSPITLPLVGWVGWLPPVFADCIYWFLYAVGIAGALWAGMQAVEDRERRLLSLVAPAVMFFPGLLQSDNLFSGNVAYILYGFVLAAAVWGWRRGRWECFYFFALIASCLKAPLLSLLAIPVLSARRQWVPACLTGAAGLALFGVQPLLQPELFRHYLQAVELQFSYNRDFSSSPAGMLANLLFERYPYQVVSTTFYLFYACLTFGGLLYTRNRFLAGRISLKQWLPVMLLGVILLDPRIMEYDVAPITVAMTLVAWRVACRMGGRALAMTAMGLFFAVANVFAALSHPAWKVTECVVLASLFVAGWLDLVTRSGGEKRCDLNSTVSDAGIVSAG